MGALTEHEHEMVKGLPSKHGPNNLFNHESKSQFRRLVLKSIYQARATLR